MNKVCVFGGSGFLGSHVADSLTEKGFLCKNIRHKKVKLVAIISRNVCRRLFKAR